MKTKRLFLYMGTVGLFYACGGDNIPDRTYPYNDIGSGAFSESAIRQFEQGIGSEQIVLNDSIMWLMDEACTVTPGVWNPKQQSAINIHCPYEGNCYLPPLLYLRKQKPLPFMHHVVEYRLQSNYNCTENDTSRNELSRALHKFFVYDPLLDTFCRHDTLTTFDYDEFLVFRKFLHAYYGKKSGDTGKDDTHLDKKPFLGQLKYTRDYPDYRQYKKWLGAQNYCSDTVLYRNCGGNHPYTYRVEVATSLSDRAWYTDRSKKIEPRELALYVYEDWYQAD